LYIEERDNPIIYIKKSESKGGNQHELSGVIDGRVSEDEERPIAEFIDLDWEDKVNSGIRLSYRPASYM
jgi:hypothetical protein